MDRVRHPRVLDLHRDRATVVQPRGVDLTDRGCRQRLPVELGERALSPLMKLALKNGARKLGRHRRRLIAQPRQRRLIDRQELRRHRGTGGDEREHLPGLHQRALGAAEQLGVALRGADVELGAVRARQLAPQSDHDCLARGTSAQRRQRSGTPQPPTGDAITLRCVTCIWGKPGIGHQDISFLIYWPQLSVYLGGQMSSTAPTRERIVDEAMRLFSQHGYAATSIAKIEAAAGLTPGAGGLYHHFHSKEAVLAAGIERQLARLGALREIRHVLGSLGDLKAELTLTARYVLAELDSESELLRILASDARNRPQLLTAAVEQLVSSTFTGFAAWISERAERPISAEEATAIASFGLGSLLSTRLLRDVLGIPAQVNDETLVDTWVQMMATALADHPPE